MKKRYKSKPEDEVLVYDENADSVDRAGAIFRLSIDGFQEFEPLLAKLLYAESFILRAQAVKSLLSIWTIPQYIDDAVRLLHSDPNWEVRADAAFALASFVKYTGQQRDPVIKELLHQLVNDEDDAVQRRCYKELCELLTADGASGIPTYFDRERDVDWELLKPYMDGAQTLQTQR